jgi:hypothetical protein
MSKSASKNEPTGYPEYAVRAEFIGRYFSPPLASSTFHDFVNKGKIVPMKGIRGFYLLNASLRRLGLREVPELPQPPSAPSFEDIVRLAFSLIDPDLFPEPSWMMNVEAINAKDVDHAIRLVEQFRDTVQSYEEVELKLAYLQGVLDWVFLETDSGMV